MSYTSTLSQVPKGARNVGQITLIHKGGSVAQTTYDAISGTNWNASVPTELPWMTGTAISLAEHKAFWVPDGAQPFDGVAAYVTWQRSIAGPPAMTNTYSWTFAVNPTQTELKFPELPGTFADLMPTLDDTQTGSNVQLVDFPGVADFKAFKQLPSGAFGCPACRTYDGTYTHVSTSP
jgi:hypothetical protein